MANYISKVKLPGNATTIYEIKDEWARNTLAELNNFTHYLGVTSTAITDGGTAGDIVIDGVTWTKGTEYSEASHTYTTGCIVTANSATSYTPDEFICNSSGKWQKFGNMKGAFGALAYKDTASSSYTPAVTGSKGTLAVASATIAAADRPLVLTTTAVTGATSFGAINTITAAKANVTVSGSPVIIPTNMTANVTGTTTLSGSFTGVTGVTGGTGTKNSATALALYAVTGGQKLVTDVAINTSGTGLVEGVTVSSVTGGKATVGSSTVYGLAGSTTKYMTGPESLDKKNLTVVTGVTAVAPGTANAVYYATVVDEILTLSAISAATGTALSSTTGITNGTSATATAYTVGKSGDATFTQPTVTLNVDKCGLTITSNTYKVSVPANTWITSVTAAAATTGTINVEVSGDIAASGAVTVGSWGTSTITLTGKTDANVITGLTSSVYYGKVNVPAHTHSHTLSGDIVVTPTAKTVTVS